MGLLQEPWKIQRHEAMHHILVLDYFDINSIYSELDFKIYFILTPSLTVSLCKGSKLPIKNRTGG
jgi:hypothetical protein